MSSTINVNGMTGYPVSFIKSSGTQPSQSSFGSVFHKIVCAEGQRQSGQVFQDMWKSRFPGAGYHVMDASNISQGIWERNDFPFEKFFMEEVDESVLNWSPTGKEPDMANAGVQNRLDSTLGRQSIMVPPELEDKMKDDPALAKQVMDKVDSFIANHPTRPGRILSYLIALDENGDVARFRITGGGGHISGPSAEELRQFEAEQTAKKEKKAKRDRETIERIQKNADEDHRMEMESIRRRCLTDFNEQDSFIEIGEGAADRGLCPGFPHYQLDITQTSHTRNGHKSIKTVQFRR